MSSLISFACPLLAFGAITANDVAFVSARLVDYHDQQELPVPRSAGLEELVGRNQSDRAASVISPQEPSDLPHRPLLRIEFRSPVDLRAVARRDATVFLHAYFCSHQDDLAVLSAPTIYADGEPIRAREQRTENSAAGIPGQDFKYYFYVNTLRKENRESRPPQMGFDLRVTAEKYLLLRHWQRCVWPDLQIYHWSNPRTGHLGGIALTLVKQKHCRDDLKRTIAAGGFGVESSRLRSLSLRGERGNHTIYFCELPRVTVRVNLRANGDT